MLDLSELKEWLRIDGEDEDITLSSLISASRMIIKKATGVTESTLNSDSDAIELYKLTQKIIISNLYNEKTEELSTNKGLATLYIQLETMRGDLLE